MAFPIKVICFSSGLYTHLGLLCSEPSSLGRGRHGPRGCRPLHAPNRVGGQGHGDWPLHRRPALGPVLPPLWPPWHAQACALSLVDPQPPSEEAASNQSAGEAQPLPSPLEGILSIQFGNPKTFWPEGSVPPLHPMGQLCMGPQGW